MNDRSMEQEIVDLGLTAPRITLEHIMAMLDRVEIHIGNPPSTTSTFAHAFLDGKFLLATGHTACVDPSNFNAELGAKYATERAFELAKDKLYELEGYRLYCEQAAAQEA
jgi:hypothetical protein